MMTDIPEVPAFDPTKKKKKKKVIIDEVANTSKMSETVTEGTVEGATDKLSQHALHAGEEANKDYVYEELLERIYGVVSIRGKTAMKLPVPEVLRQGTKRTVLVNFLEFCKIMHRQPVHLLDYLVAELGSNASVDGKNQLVIQGRFQVKHIESLLRKYAGEYVICRGCKSFDTALTKENRLTFLRCEECGSARTVTAITRGFMHDIHRRGNARRG